MITPTRSAHDMRARAEQLARSPVRLRDLALAFEDSTATTADVHVAGSEFYPPMLRDIERATSSVHINQFGFRPGVIGEQFASVLLARAAAGVAVRVVVDARGSGPDGKSRDFYARLLAGGVEVRVVRAMQLRASSRPAVAGDAARWTLEQLGHIDHRKFLIVDGRIGWVGGAGIEDHFQDGRFHDLFLRVSGPVASQLQLVFLASFRWLGGTVPAERLDALFPDHAADADADAVPATVLHNAPGRYRPITTAIARLLDTARERLDVVNPYLTDRGMIRRIESAARRGVDVRLFVPAHANNWPCAAAQHHHHAALLDAGVRIFDHPAMLHAKAFARDGEELLAGTCNLDAWSLKRFMEIDLLVRSPALVAQFDERFAMQAIAVSSAGRPMTGVRERIEAAVFAAISPFL
jgi:cardiolipin synthase A/B